jgi:hypothetical protein
VGVSRHHQCGSWIRRRCCDFALHALQQTRGPLRPLDIVSQAVIARQVADSEVATLFDHFVGAS